MKTKISVKNKKKTSQCLSFDKQREEKIFFTFITM